VGLVHKMAVDFGKEPKKERKRITKMPKLFDGTPWGFFDEESQGHPPQCRVGAVLYISVVHHFKVIYTLVRGSNMKAELTALWNLLYLSNSLNLRKLHIFGD
jgi:hypothetical protein